MNDINKHISDYIRSVSKHYRSGKATEDGYRVALAILLKSLDPTIDEPTNDPKAIPNVGKLDMVVTRGESDIGWLETKNPDIEDIVNLKGDNKKQKERYKKLANLIYTNYWAFEFIYKGGQAAYVEIAEIRDGKIVPLRKNFIDFHTHVEIFLQRPPRHIDTADALAKAMAHKAEPIKNRIGQVLIEDKGGRSSTPLTRLYDAFQKRLIPDIEIAEFADIYAETITYGLFAARYQQSKNRNITTTFNRVEAADLIPSTNPFLQNLFGHIAAKDLDPRLQWIIDPLCTIYERADIVAILQDFGHSTDPFIDFYELFLASYNPKKRKERGVWYTPDPVVDFIVSAVDDLLISEFDLLDGLADTSRIEGSDVHRVQILDPAAGTGTFLAAVVNKIRNHVARTMPDMWPNYVEKHLIPRLYGFELLMASYAICHIKLDLGLSPPNLLDLRYEPTDEAQRFNVYLTNSLTAGEDKRYEDPFAQWFAEEANMANQIKRQEPIMCIIGNPPYSGHSANKGTHFAWIEGLMEDYKREPDSQQRLQERNSKWLNDDYVKFVRLAQYRIDKTGEGILGFITNHGYLDNPTFRGMRWQLLKSFDKIYVLDLHGNANKKEVDPKGRPDNNIFSIRQGVAIIIAVKKKHPTNKPKLLAELWHGDLWGSRRSKYEELRKAARNKKGILSKKLFTQIQPQSSRYLFVPRDYTMQTSYAKGFALSKLFTAYAVGLQTARDAYTIALSKDEIRRRVQDLTYLNSEALLRKYALGKETRAWQIDLVKQDVIDNFSDDRLVQIAYRPFDVRWTLYTGNTRGFHYRPSKQILRHMMVGKNIAFCFSNKPYVTGMPDFEALWVIDKIIDVNFFRAGGTYIAPLYYYPNEKDVDRGVRLNFDTTLYQAIRKAAGMATDTPAPQPEILETARSDARADEVKVFDYIYAVLHCPTYRKIYREHLKSDFPCVPLPSDAKSFAKLSAQGETLRLLHLIDKKTIGVLPREFDIAGDNKVTRIEHSTANKSPRVYINDSQYFDNVPKEAWEMSIGGLRPAQKWLRDRKDCVLDYDDIKHYRQIIKVLSETAKLMKQIKVPNLPTKWPLALRDFSLLSFI